MSNHIVIFKLKDNSIKIADNSSKVKEILNTHYQDIICIVINIPVLSSLDFCELPELSEVIIETDTFISNFTFSNCRKLERIIVKDDCKVTIHPSAFLGCDELKCIIGCPTNIRVGKFLPHE